MTSEISINRAPVLTLWAAVVAQRLGFNWDEAVSLGKAVAGLSAQAKGRRLGIFKPQEEKTKAARQKERGEQFWVEICGRSIPAMNTAEGIRAVSGRAAVDSDNAQYYLESKFGDQLDAVRTAMTTLAKAYRPRELAAKAFGLYETFRPEIPKGVKGWGAKGILDLRKIKSLGTELGLR